MAIEAKERNTALKEAVRLQSEALSAQQALLHAEKEKHVAQLAHMAQETLAHACRAGQEKQKQNQKEREITVLENESAVLDVEVHRLEQHSAHADQELVSLEKNIKNATAKIASLTASKQALAEVVSQLELEESVVQPEDAQNLLQECGEVEREIERLKQEYDQKGEYRKQVLEKNLHQITEENTKAREIEQVVLKRMEDELKRRRCEEKEGSELSEKIFLERIVEKGERDRKIEGVIRHLDVCKKAHESITEEDIKAISQVPDYVEEEEREEFIKNTLLFYESLKVGVRKKMEEVLQEKKQEHSLTTLINLLYVLDRTHYGMEFFCGKYKQYIGEVAYEAYRKSIADGEEMRREIAVVGECMYGFSTLFTKKILDALPKNVSVSNREKKDLNKMFLLAARHGLDWSVSRMLSLGIYKGKLINMYQTDMLQTGNWRGEALPLLHLAVIRKQAKMVQLFLDRGFDIHTRDTVVQKNGAVRGWTALHYLMRNTPFDKESLEILKHLLAHGVASEICAEALTVAKEKGFSVKVISLLEKAVKKESLMEAGEKLLMSPVQGVHFFEKEGQQLLAVEKALPLASELSGLL